MTEEERGLGVVDEDGNWIQTYEELERVCASRARRRYRWTQVDADRLQLLFKHRVVVGTELHPDWTDSEISEEYEVPLDLVADLRPPGESDEILRQRAENARRDIHNQRRREKYANEQRAAAYKRVMDAHLLPKKASLARRVIAAVWRGRRS